MLCLQINKKKRVYQTKFELYFALVKLPKKLLPLLNKPDGNEHELRNESEVKWTAWLKNAMK